MRRVALILAAAAMLAAASDASALEVGARGMYWFPSLSGNLQSSTNGIPETSLDVKDDLGIGDKNFLGGEAFLRAGRVRFSVGYIPLRYEGTRQLTQQIVFQGTTFNVSDNVTSKIDLKMIDAELEYDLLRPDLAAANFYLGLILKVKYVDGRVELRSASAPPESEDFKAPVPMAGLAAGVGILSNVITADARLAGIGYSGNHLVEGDFCVSVAPLPFVRFQGGYRYIDLKIDEDEILARLKIKGPYVGAQLSF